MQTVPPTVAPFEFPTSGPIGGGMDVPTLDSSPESFVPSDLVSDSPSGGDAPQVLTVAPVTSKPESVSPTKPESVSPTAVQAASPPTSKAPTSVPTVTRNSMAGQSPPVNSTANTTGIIVGSVIGGIVGGMILMAAIVRLRRPNALIPPTTGDTTPAAPVTAVSPPPDFIPSTRAVPVTGAIVSYKDQCQSVAKAPTSPLPFREGGANSAAPPLARLSDQAADRGDSTIVPLAVAVAMGPPSIDGPLEP
jgi:hypothetical protein